MSHIDWDTAHPLEGAHRFKRRALEDAHRRTVAAAKGGDAYVYRAYKGRRLWPWRVVRGTVRPTPGDETLVGPDEPGQGSDTIDVKP